ncbi:MAG TPA: HAD-IC family P-type ATPase [Anaerolineaceae bacterium]|nr:HAD-IC family P-type ATPase [Anaerolineaceae bacterium]HPN54090.1 HAD-IC family P-type ATPase [Anaerolineaceae bacterium]
MQTLLSKHWHHLPPDEVLALLESDQQKGLDVFEVEHRLRQFGQNVLTPRDGKSPLIQFLLQFKNPLIIILLITSLITAVIKDPVDALIILAVVLANTVIGFIQEAKAEKAIEALAQTLTTETTVIRAGEKQRISAALLVPGDIVFVQAGDRVPADIRLVRSSDLQVAEAALTGESLPVKKDAGAFLPTEAVLADRRTMIYASTLATYGQGTGVVVSTGDNTEVGRISQLISEAHELETPLTRKIAQFSRLVLAAVLVLAGLTFAVGVLRGEDVVTTFTTAVALTVAMIPEGLPAALTVTLAIGVSRMAQRRAIIRKLPAVETLGGVTVICSDKTGTLTQNQMTTLRIVAGGRTYTTTGSGYNPAGEILFAEMALDGLQAHPALRECLTAGLLCNDSAILEENGEWKAQGDPTEVALVVSARKAGLLPAEMEAALPRLAEIPFDSQHQYMATLHAAGSQTRLVYVKGSVEAVLARCTTALDEHGEVTPLDAKRVHADVDGMAREGLRVLAFARIAFAGDVSAIGHENIAAGLTFLGLQAIMDPPRPEVIPAVRTCQQAGVQVKMITGDHALTAAAIAVQVGLAQPCPDSTPPSDCVLTGSQLAQLSDAQLIDAVRDVSVFARVSPEQKLRLVEALQARGEVVAMTGDGVNDGPALKKADIGIAMGITGTEVAKEAADMVLTDDNFATIEAAVEEGRSVFDNLTKIIVWALPTNVGEGLILLLAVFLGAALPVLPVHILWINTVTSALLGLVLAVEPREAGIMKRAPRSPNAPILTPVLSWRILLVGVCILAGAFGLYELSLATGVDIPQARTIAVNAIVMIEIFYLFNCRSLSRSFFAVGPFSNRWVVVGVAGMILLQMLFTYAPFMNDLFQSAPLDAAAWGYIIGVSVAAYLIVELEKWLRRRSESHRR